MYVDYTEEESDKKKAYAKGIIGIIIALIVLMVLYNCGVAVNIDAVRVACIGMSLKMLELLPMIL